MPKCGSSWTGRRDRVSAVAIGLVANVVLWFWLARSPRPFFDGRDSFVEMQFWLDRSPRQFFVRRDRFGRKCRFAVLAGPVAATVFRPPRPFCRNAALAGPIAATVFRPSRPFLMQLSFCGTGWSLFHGRRDRFGRKCRNAVLAGPVAGAVLEFPH